MATSTSSLITTAIAPKTRRGSKVEYQEKTTSSLVAEIAKGESIRIHGEVDGEKRLAGWEFFIAPLGVYGLNEDVVCEWMRNLLPSVVREGANLLNRLRCAHPKEYDYVALRAATYDWFAENSYPFMNTDGIPMLHYLSTRPIWEADREAYDRTWNLGDYAEHGSFNLSYYGTITAIGPKSVEITDNCSGERKRLDLWSFYSQNRNWTLEKARKRNSEWMD
jgi:hypothetical protein